MSQGISYLERERGGLGREREGWTGGQVGEQVGGQVSRQAYLRFSYVWERQRDRET
jgi:hypothetical protein